MIKRFLAGFLCLILFAFMSGELLAASKQEYPRETSFSENGAVFTRTSEWNGDKNKATITLTFDGFAIEGVAADVLFILDSSESMRQVCTHTGHQQFYTTGPKTVANTSATYMNTVANGGLGLDWDSQLKPLVEAAITNGAIDDSLPYLDPQVLIEIPDGLSPAGTDLYLFPAEAPADVSFANALHYSAWEIVDFAATAPRECYENLYDGYHCEIGGDGIVTRMCYQNETTGRVYESYSDSVNPDTQYEYWWDAANESGCQYAAKAAYSSLLTFSEQILNNSYNANIAFAAFNDQATDRISQGQLAYSQNLAEIENYLMTTLYNAAGETNYHAGWLSGKQVVDEWMAASGESANRKFIVFITDGVPNTRSPGNGLGGDMTLYVESLTADRYTQAQAVAQAIVADYPEIEICTASYSVSAADIETYITTPFLTEGGTHFTIDNSEDIYPYENAFADIFNSIYAEITVAEITDIIDNRYFTVDVEALTQNTGNVYYPDDAEIKVETLDRETLLPCELSNDSIQRVTFGFPNGGSVTETVHIPVLLRSDINEKYTAAQYPTGFDLPDGQFGATARYFDLDEQEHTLSTTRGWLPVGSVSVYKCDKNDEDKALEGAEFALYYTEDDTLFSKAEYKSDEKGVILIQSLPPGEYYLLETEAPEGYSRSKKKQAFTICVPSEQNVELTIENNQKLFGILPSTGDNPGLYVFALALLAATGVTIYTVAKKRKQRRKTV